MNDRIFIEIMQFLGVLIEREKEEEEEEGEEDGLV